jgi:uncharacterized membrane protein YhaH (DUF805 family)
MNKYFFGMLTERLTRSEYWTFFGYSVLYAMVVIGSIILVVEFNPAPSQEMKYAIFSGLIVSYIPLIWGSVVTCIKRVRDTGLSGWWYALQIIPYVGLVAALVYAFAPTDYFLKYRHGAVKLGEVV